MSFSAFGNETSVSEARWVPEPNTRGTYSILESCIGTLLLCIWGAVHMNIPPVREPKHKQMLRRIGWMVYALLVPEMVAIGALDERRRAAKVLRIWKRTFLSSAIESPWCPRVLTYLVEIPDRIRLRLRFSSMEYVTPVSYKIHRKHQWTMTHAHLVVMGGLVLPYEAEKPFVPADSPVPILNVKGFKALCKHDPGCIPDISENDIADRNKRDNLSRLFICLQATWFLAQCLSRLSQHLSMSLLELTTFAHSLCAIVIYLTWWDKPYDVTTPIVVEGDLAAPISAYNFMHFQKGNYDDSILFDSYRTKYGNRSFVVYSDDRWTRVGELEYVYRQFFPREFLQRDNEGRWFYKNLELGTGAITVGDVLKTISRFRTRDSPLEELPLPLSFAAWAGDETRHERWRLFWSLSQRIPMDELYKFKDLTDRRVPMTWFALPGNSYVGFYLGFTLPGLIYGGLHGLAWNAALPTMTELLLWRVSVVIIAASAFGVAMFATLGYQSRTRATQNMFYAVLACINGIWVWLLILIYFSARAYLIVEAFRALPYSPSGVYELPQWSAYFPHVG